MYCIIMKEVQTIESTKSANADFLSVGVMPLGSFFSASIIQVRFAICHWMIRP